VRCIAKDHIKLHVPVA